MVFLKVNFLESTTLYPLTLHFDVQPQNTIYYLKQRIQIGYPSCQIGRQVLLCDGNTLEDHRTIASYGFGDHDVLELHLNPVIVHPPDARFNVRVHGIREFVVEVCGTMSVAVLKDIIAPKWQVRRDRMTLYHKNAPRGINQLMIDTSPVYEYNMDEDSIVEAHTDMTMDSVHYMTY